MAAMVVEKPCYPAPLMPRDRGWIVDDLEALPDDGFRYELVDGMLFVTPAPTFSHQAHRLARGGGRRRLDAVAGPRLRGERR